MQLMSKYTICNLKQAVTFQCTIGSTSSHACWHTIRHTSSQDAVGPFIYHRRCHSTETQDKQRRSTDGAKCMELLLFKCSLYIDGLITCVHAAQLQTALVQQTRGLHLDLSLTSLKSTLVASHGIRSLSCKSEREHIAVSAFAGHWPSRSCQVAGRSCTFAAAALPVHALQPAEQDESTGAVQPAESHRYCYKACSKYLSFEEKSASTANVAESNLLWWSSISDALSWSCHDYLHASTLCNGTGTFLGRLKTSWLCAICDLT